MLDNVAPADFEADCFEQDIPLAQYLKRTKAWLTEMPLNGFCITYRKPYFIKSLLALKALANKDTLLRTQMFPHLPAHATFVADTKNVSDFVQKHFVSATNVSQFAQPKKHHEQKCVRNNVSSFASTLRDSSHLHTYIY